MSDNEAFGGQCHCGAIRFSVHLRDGLSKPVRPIWSRQWSTCMASNRHLAIIRQGGKVWNAWMLEHSDEIPNLRRASLKGSELEAVYLGGANLQNHPPATLDAGGRRETARH